MSNFTLRKTIALGSVALLLLAELSLFHDFFYPFRFQWNQGKIIEVFLSLILFFWSLLGAFLIFMSGRSLFRKITLPFFLFFFLFNIGYYKVANALCDFQQTVIIVNNFKWFFGAVVENYGVSTLPFLLIFIPIVLFVERVPDLSKLNIPKWPYIVPVSTVFLIIFGLHYSHGFFDRYPSFFRIPAMLVFAGQNRIYDGERSEVAYSGYFEAQVEKIVLIVDESIRGDILGINGY